MTDEEARLRKLLRNAAGAAPRGDLPAALAAVRRRTRRRRITRVGGAGVLAAGVAAAAAVVVVSPGTDVTHNPGLTTTLGPVRLTGALVSFDGCGDYLHYVRRRAAHLVGPYGLNPPPFYGRTVFNDGLDADFSRQIYHAPAATGATVPVPSPPAEHSTTTVQVAGVDEPDTVKTDGRIVVTLTGPTLRVLDTHAHVLGSLRLHGDTSGGLLLDGDRAVVLSSVNPSSRAAVVDLSQPAKPRLLHTFVFDGTAVAARLVDGRVMLTLRSDGPRLDFQTPSSSLRPRAAKLENRRLVKTSTLDDWLPSWQVEAPDGSTSARRHLADCTSVARPRVATGLATVSVVSLDPAEAAPSPATSVVAAGDTVYATADHVYVAGVTDRKHPGHKWRVPHTRVYDFATSPTAPPRFVASGWVRGALLSSYAMDEDAAGHLRVASTTTGRRGQSDNRITVLAPVDRKLARLGVVRHLGHGQQLRAVRFLGDTAYLVTFRTFDPLYVVDLRDASRPRVVGRLEQPGYSTYLYPLGAGRLLGVGVRIRNGEPSRMLVSTYDVSDPAHPRLIQSAPLAHGFRASSGDFDPHAFLSWPAAHLVVVAVPNGGGAVAFRLNADGGVTRLTRLAHGRLTPTRTLVIGAEVWAVTPAGVITASLPAVTGATWHHY